MGVNRLTKAFSARKTEGRKALIIYLSAGDPSLEMTARAVQELSEAGVDIIELGVPFSDPIADGPVIQAASNRALSSLTNLKKIIELVKELRSKVKIPLVLMSYYNPFLQYGIERLAADLDAAEADGVIIPDLPLEENTFLRESLDKKNIATIPLVAPTTPKERLNKITKTASGFVYCVSLTGVTGAREDLPPGIKEYLERVRDITDIPIAVGFGINGPEQARQLSPLCDGIIVGSAVVRTLHEEGISKTIELVKKLRQSI
ncbi:MAG: tryptophan synthase alpha chain [Clostridia bacterium]|nr:tryptophan synthase alpha chain [Clostridia bacterium]